MKSQNRIIFAALAALVTSIAVAGQSSMQGMPGMKGMSSKTQTLKSTKVVQKVTIIVDNGFNPSTINVKAGKPVQLTFDTKHKKCASSVVFSSLKLTKMLTDGKKTVVTFTPKKAGMIEFACGMGMYKGSVIAK